MTRSSWRIRNAAQNSKASNKTLKEKERNDYKENKLTENIRTLEKEQTKQNQNLLHVSTPFRKRDKKDFPSNKKKKKARSSLDETKHDASYKQEQNDVQSPEDSSKSGNHCLSVIRTKDTFEDKQKPNNGKNKNKKISRRRKVGSRPKSVNQTKDSFVRTQLGPLCNAFMSFANMTTFENESVAEVLKGVPMAIVALDHVVEKPLEQISDLHKIRKVPKLIIFSNTKSNAKLINDALFRKEIERAYFGDVSAFRSSLFGTPYVNHGMRKDTEGIAPN